MALKLYYSPRSPPCQLVLLIGKHLNLEFELILFTSREDILASSDILKVNPAHTVPTLDDNGFHLPESRAIAIYLLEKYGKDDALLPKDVKTRALVNHRLFFDLGVLWERVYAIVKSLLFMDIIPPKERYTQLEEGIGFLDAFLEGHKWLVGDSITVADYATLISVSYLNIVPGIELSKYLNVSSWFDLVKKSVNGYDEIVTPYVETRKQMLIEKLNSLK